MSTNGRPPILRWWGGLTQSDRLEVYILVTLYGNVVLIPLLAAGSFVTSVDPGVRPVATILAAGLHVVVCTLLMRAGIATYLGRAPRPDGWIRAGAATAAVAGVVAVVAYPGSPDGPGMVGLQMAVTLYAIALSTVIRPRTVLLTVGVAGCLAVYAVAFAQRIDHPAWPVLALALIVLALSPACRVTLWTLGMVRELERTRRVDAELAVAQERLRFARDLHDVLGRSLSAVAVKSGLAARLADLGRAGAGGEMLEVQRIAQDSLVELRAVVAGYRTADLATELGGARALLTSAGIACRVEGLADLSAPVRLANLSAPVRLAALSAPVQGVLGWAVREGTTNVLRHTAARECVISLRSEAGTVVLTMENDGAPAGDEPVRPGNGLAGLTERVAAAGGTVTAGHRAPDGFRLVATVPAGEHA